MFHFCRFRGNSIAYDVLIIFNYPDILVTNKMNIMFEKLHNKVFLHFWSDFQYKDITFLVLSIIFNSCFNFHDTFSFEYAFYN